MKKTMKDKIIEYEKRHYEKFGEHFATAYNLECGKGL